MTKPKDFLPNSQPIQPVCGIYMIYCIPNERAYIGSSINVRERVATHKNDLSKDQHHCAHLQGAFNKYGKENFQYVLLEVVNDTAKEVLVSYENKYLLQVERDFIFNIQVPAKLSYQTPKGTNTGRIWTEEQREIQRQRAKAQGVAHLFTPEVRARNIAITREVNKTMLRATKEEHHNSKVDLETALAIKAEYDSLVTPGKIGRGVLSYLTEKYNLGRSLIESICYGRHWSNPEYNSKDKANFSAKAEISCFEEVTVGQCEALKAEYREIFARESNGRKRIPGLVISLAKKHGIKREMAERIICGRHWSNTEWVPYRHREEKAIKRSFPEEFMLRIRYRYEEIKQEAGLQLVKGINEKLQQEFQLDKQDVIYCLAKTREISS